MEFQLLSAFSLEILFSIRILLGACLLLHDHKICKKNFLNILAFKNYLSAAIDQRTIKSPNIASIENF